jgi:branched-subunit amino acid transport protein
VRGVWIAVTLMGIGSIAIRATGPLLIGGRALPPRVMGLISMLAPALLAALVATNVFAGDRELVLDARVVGFGAAGLLVALRAPVLAVVVVAAAVTALARTVS